MKQNTSNSSSPFNFEFEVFQSYTEFFQICDSRSQNFGTARATTDNDSDWRGAKNYDEARQKTLYGCSDDIPKIRKTLKTMQKNAPTREYQLQENIQGFVPIVPNALLGLPNSMLDLRLKPKKQKIVSFYIDTAVPSYVSTEEYKQHGIEVLNLLLNLEKQGYRVRLSLLSLFCQDRECNSCAYGFSLPVKNENQPLDLKRVAYPVLSTGFERYCCFDWYERLPGATQFSAYGYSLSVRNEDLNQELLNTVLPSYGYYINHKTNLNDLEQRISNPDSAIQIKQAG